MRERSDRSFSWYVGLFGSYDHGLTVYEIQSTISIATNPGRVNPSLNNSPCIAEQWCSGETR
jgi:hypothetical protein